MKTFLIDLHGGLARLGAARPVLYPFLARGTLELLGAAEAAGGGLAALAESVRISMLRDFRPCVQVVFLVDLPAGPAASGASLVEQVARVREEFLSALAARGLQPDRVVVVALDSLARELDTGVPLDAAALRRWEHDVEALHAGGPTLLADLHLLRFPLRRSPEPAFQHDLVQLVYLAGALVELFEAGDALGAGRLFSVEEVALDAAAVGGWMEEYERCLLRARDAITHQLEHPEPVALRLIEDADCGCAGALEPVKLEQRNFARLRGADDTAGWRRWGQETGAALAAYTDAAETLVRRCTREWRAREFGTAERQVKSVADTAAELRERVAGVRRRLAEHARAPGEGGAWDWDDEMQRMTPRVHALVDARPRLRAGGIFTTALAVLLVVPVYLTLPLSHPLPGRLAMALLLLAAVAAVAWQVTGVLLARLHRQAHRALERATEISHAVLSGAERRKRHLALLCEAEVARRNDAEAQRAQREARRRTLLLQHHRAALEQHLAQARAVARLFAARRAPGHLAAAGVETGAEADRAALVRGWDLDRPPEHAPGYAPALCAGSRPAEPYEVRIVARVVRRESPLLRGLQYLRLADDVVYRPPARASRRVPPPRAETGPDGGAGDA